jgi:hypothetical protein
MESGREPEIYHANFERELIDARIAGLVNDPDVVIVGTNIAYDMGCLLARWPEHLEAVERAYDDGRVYDVAIAESLNAIARGHLYRDPITGKDLGRYSLDTLCQVVLGRFDAKDRDFWRLRYALLEDIPLGQWPDDAILYPLDDARNTLAVAEKQLSSGYDNMGDHKAQAGAAWDLQKGAIWGSRTDPESVAELAKTCDENRVRDLAKFQAVGFYKADGTKSMSAVKRAVVLAYDPLAADGCKECKGLGYTNPITKTGKISSTRKSCAVCQGTGCDLSNAPKTEKDGVQTSRDTLLESGDDHLMDFALVSESEKWRTTYVPMLQQGTEFPISFRPNVLLETGRSSYEGLIQLIPRGGGIRECFRARDGFLFCSADYAQVELCTLAQVLIWLTGDRSMAEMINSGMDLHCGTGANLLGIDYADFVKQKADLKVYRQCAKAVNFGLPGGMGAPKFVFANRNRNAGSTKAPDGKEYVGLRFCILLGGAERCGEKMISKWGPAGRERDCPRVCHECVKVVQEKLKPAWFRTFPGMRDYFKVVGELVEAEGSITQFVSERVRGGIQFTQAANGYFQALAADGIKKALRSVSRECYLGKDSPLYGTRVLMSIHDELFSEMPRARASDAAKRKVAVMAQAFEEYCPDVRVRAEPCLMERWYKQAELVTNESGEILPWEPKK